MSVSASVSVLVWVFVSQDRLSFLAVSFWFVVEVEIEKTKARMIVDMAVAVLAVFVVFAVSNRMIVIGFDKLRCMWARDFSFDARCGTLQWAWRFLIVCLCYT